MSLVSGHHSQSKFSMRRVNIKRGSWQIIARYPFLEFRNKQRTLRHDADWQLSKGARQLLPFDSCRRVQLSAAIDAAAVE